MLPVSDLQGYVIADRAALAALMVPESGVRLHTIVGIKTLAQVFAAPGGDGVTKLQRRYASGHDAVSVTFRGDTYWGKPAPACSEFNAGTVKWAARNSREIAIWSAPYPDCQDDIGAWMVSAANAGSPFQTLIETTPLRAAEWGAAIARWKGPTTVVRFFGPEVVQ
jgi:hypothetical protein